MRRRNDILYGVQRETPAIEYLNAGPIRMKFQDGELRYLRVGGKEIVRRIYFAVRDSRYDTVMPKFKSIDIRKEKDRFRIDAMAKCTNEIASYSCIWRITGTAAGEIIFSVNGKAETDFKSPRIGINVLYGAESLAGQKYKLSGVAGKDLFDEAGRVVEGEFPRLISPSLLAKNYRTLRYTTSDGMEVVSRLAIEHFGMEDQRNYGDSSYKAFSGIPHSYPNLKKGDRGGQTFILQVKNTQAAPEAASAHAIVIGGPVKGASMPMLLPAAQSIKGQRFSAYNDPGSRAGYANTERIVLPFNPAAHMPDDDTFMENIPAIHDQVMSIRSFAAKAQFRVGPITIDSPYPRPGPDPRNNALFAAAWCARMVKYLALAGVDEAGFKIAPAYAPLVLKNMAAYAGRSVLETSVGPHADIDALAIDDKGRRIVWLINKTDRPQGVRLEKFTDAPTIEVLRLNASMSLKSGLSASQEVAAPDGSPTLHLRPFEVCMVK